MFAGVPAEERPRETRLRLMAPQATPMVSSKVSMAMTVSELRVVRRM